MPDGYLSADERGGNESDANDDVDGGAVDVSATARAQQPGKLQLTVNLKGGGNAPAALAHYCVAPLQPTPINLEASESSADPIRPRGPVPKVMTASEELCLAQMVHGSHESSATLCERFREVHPEYSKAAVERKIKGIAGKRKRPVDAIAIWLLNDEYADGFGLEEPPPARAPPRARKQKPPESATSLEAVAARPAEKVPNSKPATQPEATQAAAPPRVPQPVDAQGASGESPGKQPPAAEGTIASGGIRRPSAGGRGDVPPRSTCSPIGTLHGFLNVMQPNTSSTPTTSSAVKSETRCERPPIAAPSEKA